MFARALVLIAAGVLSACTAVAPIEPEPAASVAPATASSAGFECRQAFERLPGEMRRLPDVGDAGAELDASLAACASLATWLEAASDALVVAQVDAAAARRHLEERCETSDTLTGAPICGEVD